MNLLFFVCIGGTVYPLNANPTSSYTTNNIYMCESLYACVCSLYLHDVINHVIQSFAPYQTTCAMLTCPCISHPLSTALCASSRVCVLDNGEGEMLPGKCVSAIR